jgi:structural maintenance of chromosome 3 (chondroitin sulfate proteoglycan 6)
MKMSTMKDSERLDLLKEIGGTKVYEERRRESLKIMQENEVRKNQIQEVVSYCFPSRFCYCSCAASATKRC